MAGETRGENELVHVSGRDVFLGAPDSAHVVGTTVSGRGRRILPRARVSRKPTAEGPNHLVPQGTPLLLGTGMNERNAASEVIENQQGTRRHVVERGNTALEPGSGREPLKEAHHIV